MAGSTKTFPHLLPALFSCLFLWQGTAGEEQEGLWEAHWNLGLLKLLRSVLSAHPKAQGEKCGTEKEKMEIARKETRSIFNCCDTSFLFLDVSVKERKLWICRIFRVGREPQGSPSSTPGSIQATHNSDPTLEMCPNAPWTPADRGCAHCPCSMPTTHCARAFSFYSTWNVHGLACCPSYVSCKDVP